MAMKCIVEFGCEVEVGGGGAIAFPAGLLEVVAMAYESEHGVELEFGPLVSSPLQVLAFLSS